MDIYGIIGDPIAHSLSPLIQNFAFQSIGRKVLYTPFHVRPGELKDFITAARRWPCLGFNVTLPHKEAIVPLLDTVSEEARAIGAVNTVSLVKDKLHGDNTDARGYLRSLAEQAQWQATGHTAVVMGGGGAARAVAYGLLSARIKKIYLANRTLKKAQRIEKDFGEKFSKHITAVEWLSPEMSEAFTEADLLVNATSVGLNNSAFDALPLGDLRPAALVSDLIYQPRVTPLLKEARRLGLKTHEGWGMFLYQGVESFKIWTGLGPDVAGMERILLQATPA